MILEKKTTTITDFYKTNKKLHYQNYLHDASKDNIEITTSIEKNSPPTEIMKKKTKTKTRMEFSRSEPIDCHSVNAKIAFDCMLLTSLSQYCCFLVTERTGYRVVTEDKDPSHRN